MTQFLSFIQKEFYHVFRDAKTLLMLFGIPIVLIVLFGFAISNEIKNAPIIVCDYANDSSSRAIINKLSENELFTIQNTVYSYAEIEQTFKKESVKLALIFPHNFHSDLMRFQHVDLQIIADASDPNVSNTLTQYVVTIVKEHQLSMLKERNIPYTITAQTQFVYNPELLSAVNFVPGIMALVLLLICVMMTAVSIVKEKEMGTMELLLVSPFHPLLVIIAKAIPYFVVSLINLAVILILSVTVLKVPISGSLLLLISASTLLIIVALSLGLMISNITQSQQSAMLITLMGMLIPTLLFTGFLFPIENMPIILQYISYIIPSKWYYIIAKSIMIKGLGFVAIWKEMLILLVMSAFFLFISVKQFKIRLE